MGILKGIGGLGKEVGRAFFGGVPKAGQKTGFAKADFSKEKPKNQSVFGLLFSSRPKPKVPEKSKDTTLWGGKKDINREKLARELEEQKYKIWGPLHKYDEKMSPTDVRKLGEKWFDPKKYGRNYIEKSKSREVEKKMEDNFRNASGKERFAKEAELKKFRELFVDKKD